VLSGVKRYPHAPWFEPRHESEHVAKGAAVVEVGRGRVFVYHDLREPFAECCARAHRDGRLVTTPAEM
jgi:hypothetical protein